MASVCKILGDAGVPFERHPLRGFAPDKIWRTPGRSMPRPSSWAPMAGGGRSSMR